MKKKLWIPVSSILCISLMLGSFSPVYAINTGQATGVTSSENETVNSDFKWDDDTKDDALTVFDTTDWSSMQSKLLYKDGQMNGSAKANVSSKVRDLEASVKSILEEDIFESLEYYRSDYVEITLAMIQVLAEQCGAIRSDDSNGEESIDFNQWLKSMGQIIDPSSSKGKEESIRTLISAYAYSARTYKLKKLKDNGNKEDTDTSEPYIYKNNAELQAVIEGVVMRYATQNQVYCFTSNCNTAADKPYTEKIARNFYKNHKTEIKAYYANSTVIGTKAAGAATGKQETNDDFIYLPDPSFAENVASIYSTSGGLGEDMAAYVSDCPNEKVAAFLNELAKHNKKPYVWGSKGPDSFDCSGLISYCLRVSNAIPNYSYHTSSGMRSSFKVIPYSEVQPGDILWHPGHVMVYLKDGYTFEAKGKAYGVGYFKRTTSTQTVLRWW